MNMTVLAVAGSGAAALGVWVLLSVWQSRALRQQTYRRLKDLASRPSLAAGQAFAVRNQSFSTLKPLQALISRASLTPRVADFLEQADVKLNVGAYLLMHVFGALGMAVGSAWLSLPLFASVLLTLAGAAAPAVWVSAKRRKRFRRIVEQLPDAIRLIASVMRAGLGLESGLEVVATELQEPIRGEFRKLLNEWRLYGDINEAFRRMATRTPLPDIRLFASAACLYREIGGNFAEVLDQLEGTIRSRFELFRFLKTLTAESRLSAFVLGALPLVVGLGLFIINREYFQVLIVDPIGRIMLWTGIILQAVGFMLLKMLTTPKFH